MKSQPCILSLRQFFFLFFFSKALNHNVTSSQEKHLIIVQCDSELIGGDLIACARYRVYDLKAKAAQESHDCKATTRQEYQINDEHLPHVLFLIHLSRQAGSSSLISFQGDPWISHHIDDLKPSLDKVVATSDALKFTVRELFVGTSDSTPMYQESKFSLVDGDILDSTVVEKDEMLSSYSNHESDQIDVDNIEIEIHDQNEDHENYSSMEPLEVANISVASKEMVASMLKCPKVVSSCPLYHRLHGCIQSAVSKLNSSSKRRYTQIVAVLVSLIPKQSPATLGII